METKKPQAIFLHEQMMGAGPSNSAIKHHLEGGYKICAASQATLTIKDDPEQVQTMEVNSEDAFLPG